MNSEELNKKFKIFEQQIIQVQEQLGAVEQAIFDMSNISTGIDELKGKIGEEIMAPIGRGIFVKTKLASEDLVVDVGGKTFVNKNIDDTKELIDGQVEKLGKMKTDLEKSLESINQEITKAMQESQNKSQ